MTTETKIFPALTRFLCNTTKSSSTDFDSECLFDFYTGLLPNLILFIITMKFTWRLFRSNNDNQFTSSFIRNYVSNNDNQISNNQNSEESENTNFNFPDISSSRQIQNQNPNQSP